MLGVEIAIAGTTLVIVVVVDHGLLLDVDVVARADTSHMRLAIVIQDGRRQLRKREHECLLLLLLWGTFLTSASVHVLLLLVHSLYYG